MDFNLIDSIEDILDFNPTRRLKKGDVAPFVEMAAIPENDRNISRIEYREVKGGSRFKNGDTLFSRITPCLENGKTAKVTLLNEGEVGHGSTEFVVMAAKEPEYDEDFIYYLARLPEFRTFAQNLMQGTSGRQRVSWQSLTTYESCFPKKEIRRQIGLMLKAFDDKIELNRQINQTLEEMAQAIFKSWFVDFEPVKAKMQALENGGTQSEAELAAMSVISGKSTQQLEAMQAEHPDQYQQLQHTASLFPSAMQDSELGEIPLGWEVSNIGDVTECLDRKRIPISKPIREKRQGKIPYYGATSIMDYVDDYIFDGTFVLVGEDGSVVKEDGTPFTQYIWGKSWVNNHAHVLRGNNGVSTEQVLLFMQKTDVNAFVTGAVQLKINQRNLNSIPFLKASNEVNSKFSFLVCSIYLQLKSNTEENLKLAEIRDSLLPKLLSGELQISTEDVA